ncbi:MAG TPA: hypothetical protein VLK22_02925 [Candidatus Udaeobacter sp.]|nr:hypothetical protein [Candidatus Udaeobacter sp.]
MSTEQSESQITKEVHPNPQRKWPLNLVLTLVLTMVLGNSAWMFYVITLKINLLQQYHDENVCLKQQLRAQEQPALLLPRLQATYLITYEIEYTYDAEDIGYDDQTCQGESVQVNAYPDPVTGSFFTRTPSLSCENEIHWDWYYYLLPSFNPFELRPQYLLR